MQQNTKSKSKTECIPLLLFLLRFLLSAIQWTFPVNFVVFIFRAHYYPGMIALLIGFILIEIGIVLRIQSSTSRNTWRICFPCLFFFAPFIAVGTFLVLNHGERLDHDFFVARHRTFLSQLFSFLQRDALSSTDRNIRYEVAEYVIAHALRRAYPDDDSESLPPPPPPPPPSSSSVAAASSISSVMNSSPSSSSSSCRRQTTTCIENLRSLIYESERRLAIGSRSASDGRLMVRQFVCTCAIKWFTQTSFFVLLIGWMISIGAIFVSWRSYYTIDSSTAVVFWVITAVNIADWVIVLVCNFDALFRSPRSVRYAFEKHMICDAEWMTIIRTLYVEEMSTRIRNYYVRQYFEDLSPVILSYLPVEHTLAVEDRLWGRMHRESDVFACFHGISPFERKLFLTQCKGLCDVSGVLVMQRTMQKWMRDISDFGDFDYFERSDAKRIYAECRQKYILRRTKKKWKTYQTSINGGRDPLLRFESV